MNWSEVAVEKAVDMISVHDAEGNYLYVNEACSGMLGRKPEDMVGKNCYQYFHAADLEHIAAAHSDVMLDGRPIRIRLRLEHQSGEFVWVEVTSQPSTVEPFGVISVAVSRILDVRHDVLEPSARLLTA